MDSIKSFENLDISEIDWNIVSDYLDESHRYSTLWLNASCSIALGANSSNDYILPQQVHVENDRNEAPIEDINEDGLDEYPYKLSNSIVRRLTKGMISDHSYLFQYDEQLNDYQPPDRRYKEIAHSDTNSNGIYSSFISFILVIAPNDVAGNDNEEIGEVDAGIPLHHGEWEGDPWGHEELLVENLMGNH